MVVSAFGRLDVMGCLACSILQRLHRKNFQKIASSRYIVYSGLLVLTYPNVSPG